MSATTSTVSSAASFGVVKQIDGRRPRRRLRRGGPGRRARGRAAARLAVRHPQLRRRRPAAGGGGLPGDRPVPARLRDDALPAPTRRSATASRRRSRSTRSRCWTRSSIERAVVAGFDWGARTADIVAALWPERCSGLVSVSGYLIGSQAAGRLPLPPEAELQWWYQYYFATERGRAGYEQVPARVREADLADRVAAVGLRRRHVRAQRGVVRQPRPRRDRDPQLPLAARARRRRARVRRRSSSGSPTAPAITVPTITLEGDANGAPHPEPERLRRRSSPARTRTGRSRAASGTTCPRRPRRRSPTPCSTSEVEC